MNEKDLILIKTLYEEQNITHTSKRLYISQPAISDRLKKLEDELNCSLIIRQPRGILFTTAGESLYNYACQHLIDYSKLKQSIQLKKYLTTGTLKIGCSNTFSKYKMPLLLSEFITLYPNININMCSGYSHDRYKDFLKGFTQICIVRGEHMWKEKKILLFKDPLCLIAKQPINIKNLPNLPYIHYLTDPLLQTVLDDWWYSNFKEHPKTIIEVDSIETALKLVQQNLGFTLLSQMCTTDTPELFHLPLKDPSGKIMKRNTWLFYRNNYIHFTVTKAFIDFITKKFNS